MPRTGVGLARTDIFGPARGGWGEDGDVPSPIWSWLSRPWLLKALITDLRLAARLVREPSVRVWAKSIVPLWLLYLVSPIDFLPDVVPVLGQLDDLALAYGALRLFLRLSPPAAVAFHRAALAARRPFSRMSPADVVIDAEFRPHP
jgi:uncharacterized membrane protein YkvA (DUF1232 family)